MAISRPSAVVVDVLSLLLQAWEDGAEVHGWQIIKSVRRSGPSVYRVLDRLEDAGWVTGSWEDLPPHQKRPRRRYYRLTAEGVAAARQRVPLPRDIPARPTRAEPTFGMAISSGTGR